jgi:hypothetical protein
MELIAIILGIIVLFNFVVLRIKYTKGLYIDMAIDITMLIVLNTIFGGTAVGALSATAGSTMISLYLIWFPFSSPKASPTTAPIIKELKDLFA